MTLSDRLSLFVFNSPKSSESCAAPSEDFVSRLMKTASIAKTGPHRISTWLIPHSARSLAAYSVDVPSPVAVRISKQDHLVSSQI